MVLIQALLQTDLQNGFALAHELAVASAYMLWPSPSMLSQQASVLVQVRGKMACLLINDIDAGLGHFANTQVRSDLSTCFYKHPHHFPSAIAL